MPSNYEVACEAFEKSPKTWLVTGLAGFIASHLLERLLSLGQTVIGIDNFSTGKPENLKRVQEQVGEAAWKNFTFYEGSIVDAALVAKAIKNVDVVLHQAALGSVSRSVEAPMPSHEANVTGFLTVLEAAKNAKIKSFVYASSSSVYGDSPTLPKLEADIGELLSPYAATKAFNETYAKLFTRLYDLRTTGLRYFNVFGARQDPAGEYAAVIPRWIEARVKGEPCKIFGDGKTSRDFCYIDNVVQANLLATYANLQGTTASAQAYNVACAEQLSLTELYGLIDQACQPDARLDPVYEDFRVGDIRHSLADISKIESQLGYKPLVFAKEGLQTTVNWYRDNL